MEPVSVMKSPRLGIKTSNPSHPLCPNTTVCFYIVRYFAVAPPLPHVTTLLFAAYRLPSAPDSRAETAASRDWLPKSKTKVHPTPFDPFFGRPADCSPTQTKRPYDSPIELSTAIQTEAVLNHVLSRCCGRRPCDPKDKEVRYGDQRPRPPPLRPQRSPNHRLQRIRDTAACDRMS